MAEQKSFLHNNKKLFIGGALIFFILSGLLYYFAPVAGHYEVDSSAYDRIARIFLDTGTIQDVGGTPPIHTQGYHFVVGMVYWLFGIKLWPIILLQVALAFLSILLVTRAAFVWCGEAIARVVYLFAVIDGAFLVYPQFMLAETVLLFLLSLFFERIAFFYTTKNNSSLMQAGLILGLSLIVKPTALFLPVCLAFCFGALSFFVPLSITWVQFLLFCAAVYVPVLLYVIRNGLVFGSYTFSFLMDFNLYCWFPALVLAKLQAISFEESLNYVQSIADTSYSQLQAGYWKPLQAFAFNLFVHNPLSVLSMWMQNIAKTFFGLFSVQLQLLFDPCVRGNILPFFATEGSIIAKSMTYAGWAFRSPLVGSCMLFEFLINGLRWIFVLCGFYSLWSKKEYELLTFFFCIVGCFSVVTGFYGAGRYRITFEPILILLASCGIISLYKNYKRIKLKA